jgi:hypothetical protein
MLKPILGIRKLSPSDEIEGAIAQVWDNFYFGLRSESGCLDHTTRDKTVSQSILIQRGASNRCIVPFVRSDTAPLQTSVSMRNAMPERASSGRSSVFRNFLV